MECIRCGECCKILFWSDRVRMSWELKIFIWKRVCKFLANNECSIYEHRPKICREWISCGIFHLVKK